MKFVWHLCDTLTTRRKWLTRGLRRAILKQFFRGCGPFQQIKLVLLDGLGVAASTFSDNECAVVLAGMLRLQREEPYVVVGDVRGIHLPRLLGGAPWPRRAHLVRTFHPARHQLDVEAASQYAAGRKLQRGRPHYDHTLCLLLFTSRFCFNTNNKNLFLVND